MLNIVSFQPFNQAAIRKTSSVEPTKEPDPTKLAKIVEFEKEPFIKRLNKIINPLESKILIEPENEPEKRINLLA